MAKILIGGVSVNKALYDQTCKAVAALEDDARFQLIAKVNDMTYVIPRPHLQSLLHAGVVDASGEVPDKIVTILDAIFTGKVPTSKPIRNAEIVSLKQAMEGSVAFN